MKKIILFLCVVLLTLSGCDDSNYKGGTVDLNCVATNSILGLYDVDRNNIIEIAEDSFGRRMFLYWGNTAVMDDEFGSTQDVPKYIYAILISQKSYKKHVYFYPDYNFIIYDDAPSWGYGSKKKEELLQYVLDSTPSEDIEWLKQKNDWDKPLNEDKCVKVKISKKDRERESGYSFVSDEVKEKVYKETIPFGVFYRSSLYYLTSDTYDRHIYFFRGTQVDDSCLGAYVVIFNKDGSYDPETGIMEISDLWHYQDELKAFKERNGWNTPPE